MKITITIDNGYKDHWRHAATVVVDSPREGISEVYEDALGGLKAALVAAGFALANVVELEEGDCCERCAGCEHE